MGTNPYKGPFFVRLWQNVKSSNLGIDSLAIYAIMELLEVDTGSTNQSKEIVMEERTNCCEEKKNWVYNDCATVVYCSVCGKVVFDGPDADRYGYEEAE